MKKEMLINVLQPEECRIAIVEDGVLEELYVERTSHESYTGNIYKGKVVNLEPAIQAAFVDFSVGRNGFLHVSDVEPQYYQRLLNDDDELGARDRDRNPHRNRDESRPPRTEDRPPRGSTPPTPPDERPRDRERPDRSERGRRDRSEPRRFGEGLVDDLGAPAKPTPPPTPPRTVEPTREEPPRFDREEPRRARPESTFLGWSDEPAPTPTPTPPTTRLPEREARPAEPDGPRSRFVRPPVEPLDPDLPPSRTQRSRSVPPTSRMPEPDDLGRPRTPIVPPRPIEPEPEIPAAAEPRRPPRGRGRAPRPSREPEPLADLDPEPLGPLIEPEPEVEDRPEPPRRRNGGRSAIRARGGEREPERPREPAPERPRVPAAERPPTPAEPERTRFVEPERTRGTEPERSRPVEPERTRGAEPERTRSAEPERTRPRGRVPEPGSPRERTKPHSRAGEPGYVPRRERTKADDPLREPLAEALGWLDPDTALDDEIDREPIAPAEEPDDVDAEETSKVDPQRPRRKRRRGRRRERDRPDRVPGDAPSPEAEAEDDDVDEIENRLDREELDLDPDLAEGAALAEDFDFGDREDQDEDEPEEDEDEDEVSPGTTRAVASPEDEIDPELEEEIRREIEEIQELEREMGLRGPVEARPRRGEDRDAGSPRGGPRPARGRGLVKPPIQEIFRRGDEVLVQVIKESIGTKGPTLSTYISIPGRYLVLMPGLNRVGVSRKIADESQRRKLREIMNDLNPPKGLGFIVRTAGLDRTKRELARDLAYLLRLWKVILRRIKKAKAPAPIYQESDLITRTIRDIFTSEIDTIWIDEPSAFERAQEFLRIVMPRFVNRLKYYDEKVPLFHKYGIEDEIAKIQRRQIPLPEGGSIVIDQTEALVAIDVNSGNFRVENDAERTAYEMNLRAAKEIARQLRLRDLGGVIVNDFIDMRDERNRRGVERALRDAIKRDRARTKVLRMSAFGIIEMTRQRIRPSLKRSVYEDCRNCNGAGVVKTAESMAIDVMRLLALASHRADVRRVNVTVCAAVETYLNNRKRPEITRLETEAGMTIHIRHEEDAPGEHLQIDCFDAQNAEVRLIPAVAPPARRGR